MTTYHTTCKYCLRGMLTWKQVQGKWRMVDAEDVTHVCEQMRQAKIQESNLKKKYT